MTSNKSRATNYHIHASKRHVVSRARRVVPRCRWIRARRWEERHKAGGAFPVRSLEKKCGMPMRSGAVPRTGGVCPTRTLLPCGISCGAACASDAKRCGALLSVGCVKMSEIRYLQAPSDAPLSYSLARYGKAYARRSSDDVSLVRRSTLGFARRGCSASPSPRALAVCDVSLHMRSMIHVLHPSDAMIRAPGPSVHAACRAECATTSFSSRPSSPWAPSPGLVHAAR